MSLGPNCQASKDSTPHLQLHQLLQHAGAHASLLHFCEKNSTAARMQRDQYSVLLCAERSSALNATANAQWQEKE